MDARVPGMPCRCQAALTRAGHAAHRATAEPPVPAPCSPCGRPAALVRAHAGRRPRLRRLCGLPRRRPAALTSAAALACASRPARLVVAQQRLSAPTRSAALAARLAVAQQCSPPLANRVECPARRPRRLTPCSSDYPQWE